MVLIKMFKTLIQPFLMVHITHKRIYGYFKDTFDTRMRIL